MKTDKMLMGSAIFFIICVLATLAVVLLSPKPPAASVAPVTAQASGNMPMMGPGMGSGMMGKGPMMGPGMGMMGGNMPAGGGMPMGPGTMGKGPMMGPGMGSGMMGKGPMMGPGMGMMGKGPMMGGGAPSPAPMPR